MGAVITLTTDFGLADGYVAAMRGVVLGINPEAKLVDICHNTSPQNIFQAAFVLSTVYEFFPRKTIHVVVVDPGVGTSRRAIILRTPLADFVAPDNGVLSYVIQQSLARPVEEHSEFWQVELGPELEAVAITRPEPLPIVLPMAPPATAPVAGPMADLVPSIFTGFTVSTVPSRTFWDCLA